MKTYKILYQKDYKEKKILINCNDLKNETLPNNIIKIILLNENKKTKIKFSLILEFISKLNRVLQVNIPLSKAFELLLKTEKNTFLRYLLKDIITVLEQGNQLDVVFDKYTFEYKYLVKSFFNLSLTKGNSKHIINSLYNLLQNIALIKEEFFKALRYPIILCFAMFLCFLSIFIFVLPNLQEVFNSYENLPLITKSLFYISDLFKMYFFHIIILFFFIFFVSFYLFKKYKKSFYYFDKYVFLYCPIINKLIYYKNMYIFFEGLKTLMKLNYEINIAIKSSLVLLNNKFILDRMSLINEDLENGLSISEAFNKTGIVDETTLSLLDLAQKSNTLNIIIKDIVKIYKKNFNILVRKLALLIEPLFFLIISVLIVFLILGVFQPIWSISDIIN